MCFLVLNSIFTLAGPLLWAFKFLFPLFPLEFFLFTPNFLLTITFLKLIAQILAPCSPYLLAFLPMCPCTLSSVLKMIGFSPSNLCSTYLDQELSKSFSMHTLSAFANTCSLGPADPLSYRFSLLILDIAQPWSGMLWCDPTYWLSDQEMN